MSGTRWTPKDLALLAKWYCKEGRSREAIAKALHRTIFAVDNQIERKKLTRQQLTSVSRPRHRRKPGSAPAKALIRSFTQKHPFLESPRTFLEFLGVDLHGYQVDGWKLMDDNYRTILCWNRQAGKDMVLSLYGLYMALSQPGSQIICVSPSDRQSKLWMRKVHEFARSKSEIRNFTTDMSKREIAFANDSRLTSLPGGMESASTIRGFSSVSLLIFNECAYISEDVIHGTTPFLAAVPDAKTVLISTPFGTLGYFYRMWTEDLYAKSLVTADECPHITSEFLDSEKLSMPTLRYASEYECLFLSSQTAYFPTELIERVTKNYPLTELPPAEFEDFKFYLGFDPARVKGGDKSVITVIAESKDGQGQVLWLKEFEDMSYVDQCAYVSYLHSEWKFKWIFVDQSAHAVVDSLRAYRLPIKPISFSLQGKIELYGRLKAAMEAGSIIIPSHPNLNQELSTFEYRITESGNITLHGGHDDYCDSLALAAKELTTPRVSLSVTFVEQGDIVGQKAVMPLGEWKEQLGVEIGNPYKPHEPAKRGFYPWLKEGEPEDCLCGEPILGPRTSYGDTYVDANHPECVKKMHSRPPVIR